MGEGFHAVSTLQPRLTSGDPGAITGAVPALQKPPDPAVLPPDARAAEVGLVARLKAGDRYAFAHLVETYGARMLVVVRRYLPMEWDAEDALQDAFLSAWRFIGSFQGDSRLSTWLHRIAVNAALMRIRARSRRPEVLAGDTLVEEHLDRTARLPSGLGVDDLLARAEVRQRIQGSLADLCEEDRAVVRLRDIEGMGLQAIGVLLDVCQTTVKTRLHRGRKALKSRLAGWIGAGG